MAGNAGRRAAQGMWTRAEMRRRWAALAVLGLMAGAAAAVALAALAGARRTDQAYDRLAEATRAADAVIFASQVEIYAPDWSPIAALPYVEAAGSFGLPFVTFTAGPPGVDLEGAGMFSVSFGTWRTDLDRPIVLEGRLPDVDNPFEVLAPPDTRAFGVEVGQEYTVRLPSARQAANFEFFGSNEGEEVTLRVVGIGRSLFELAIIPGEGTGFIGTPAFTREFGAGITLIDNLLVRFRPGQGSVEQLERDARAIFGSPSLPVLDAAAASKRVTNGTAVEASGLLLFAVAVALASAVLAGQALTRSVRAGATDLATMRALGFTRADAARAMSLPYVIVAATAAALAVAGAVGLSSRFPIGLGRRVDPDVGTHADWLVIAPGAVVLVVSVMTTVAVTAWRATGRVTRAEAASRSRTADTLARAGAPPVVTTGARLALEPGRGRRALPTRPALAGMAVGVVGVVGALTFSSGIDDAIANPSRFGANWDIETIVWDVSALADLDRTMETIEATPSVRASALSGRALVVFGDVTQPTYALEPRVGALAYGLLRGRAPAGLGEVALGPATADTYGVGIGDRIGAVRHDGSPEELVVVGIALLPTTPHSSYDQGAWVSVGQLEALAGARLGELPAGSDPDAEPPIDPTHLAELEPGTDPSAAVDDINARVGSGAVEALTTTEPIDIGNLRNVRSLPLLFATFTVLLAAGTAAHVISSVARRRGTDLAVLRALGMTPGQTRGALSWQATILSLVGLAAGLPLGLVLGRTIWRVVADATPMIHVAPFAALALALAVPVTLVGVNVLAVWPGRRVSRLQPAESLRTE